MYTVYTPLEEPYIDCTSNNIKISGVIDTYNSDEIICKYSIWTAFYSKAWFQNIGNILLFFLIYYEVYQ